MKSSVLNNLERVLKRNLKKRVSITSALVVSFMLTGGLAFGAGQEFTDGGFHINDTDVVTTERKEHGIFTSDGTGVMNEADITTKGEKAIAIKAVRGASALNDGSLTTEGERANGMMATDKAYIQNDGSITQNIEVMDPEVDYGDGMKVVFDSEGVNNGNITTLGNGSAGALVETTAYDLDDYSEEGKIKLLKAEGESTFANNGTIDTGGDYSAGIRVESSSKWAGFDEEVDFLETEDGYIKTGDWTEDNTLTKGSRVDNNGVIATAGEESHGIVALTHDGVAKTEVYNNAEGKITTSGNGSIGVYMKNSELTNSGLIETLGDDYANGIGAFGSVIDNSGTIRTNGTESVGAIILDGSELINSGTIETTGEISRGIEALGIDEETGEPTTRTSVTNTKEGSIITRKTDSDGVHLENSDLINEGDIITEGSNSHGVEAFSGSVVNNSGSIITGGDYSLGVYLEKSELINSGNISTSGLEAHGVVADSSSSVINEESGTIATSGENAYGVISFDNSIINRGEISTSGNGAIAIRGDNLNIENKGSIGTSGEGANAIEGTELNISNSGTIETVGDYSNGIAAWGYIDGEGNTVQGGTIVNEEGGVISTVGKRSIGIIAEYSDITNNGDIITSGEGGRGIHVDFDSSAVNNGNITTTGDGGAGIYALHGSTFENNGIISTEGYRGYGAKAYFGSVVINNGSIATSGERGYGMKAEDGSDAINNGVITTEGYKSFGLRGWYDSIIKNTNQITTKGERATGLDLMTSVKGINTSEGTVTTEGLRATGARLSTVAYDLGTEEEGIVLYKIESETTLDNSGLIKTTGEESIGIVVDSREKIVDFYDELAMYEEEGEEKTGDWNFDNTPLAKGSQLNNTGTIETVGANAYGIYAHTEEGIAESEVFNLEDGIVKTTGAGAIGAYVERSNLTNEGTIETFGDEAYGVYSDNSNIDNSGTIQTHGDNSYGIYAVNDSTVNHTGKIYVDDADAYGIVIDQTTELTISEGAVIEVGGASSNGIHVITSEQPTEEIMTMSLMSFMAAAEPEADRASLTNNGVITASGIDANAIVLKDSDFVNTGTVSSERGYSILSLGGDNTVTLTDTSNIDGIIAGGSGSDTLYLKGTNKDDFDLEAYERIIKADEGAWTFEDSSIVLDAYKGDEVIPVEERYGEIIFANGTNVTIALDEAGNSGQVIAREVIVAGDITVDVDSSNNNGASEIQLENIILTEEGGLDIDELGSVTLTSEGWDSNYIVNEDGSLDAVLKRIAYTDRASGSMSDLAAAMEDSYEGANGVMRDVMNTLNDSTDSQMNDALKQICTDEYSSAVHTALSASKNFESNIRTFMNGGSGGGIARSSRETAEDRYIYATVIGNSSTYDGSSSTTGFDSDRYGAVGAYEFSNGLGISLGYLSTDTDYNDGRGSSSEADTYHIGSFYKYEDDRGLRVNTTLAFDYTTNDVSRNIAIGDVSETAKSDFDSYSVSLGSEVMYDFYLGNNYRVTPKLALTYGRIEQDSFSETGAGSLNISQSSQSYNSFRSSAGVEAAKEVFASSGTYELSAYLQWNHEFGDVYDDQEISIQDLEGKFAVPGLDISEDTYEMGIGIEYTTNSGTTYFGTYSYEGDSSYDNHTGKLGVKYRF